MELTRTGLTDDEIARELGYANRSGVWKARQRAVEAQLAESVEEYRTLEVERLDALQETLWDAAMSGELADVREVRAFIQLRCRVLGLLLGNPERKPDRSNSVVLPEFWEHARVHHPHDWTACRCPSIVGGVKVALAS